MEVDFNINHHVQVRLTDLGRKIHRDRYERLVAGWNRAARADLPYVPPKEDGDGWASFQLWDLMAIYGPHMGLSCDLTFQTEIRIPEGQK